MTRAIFLCAILALPACQPTSAPPPADTCGAMRCEYLRGKPESQVLAVSFNQPVRIIAHRENVTLDFVPERLNFALDGNGNVIGITCG